MRKPHIKIYFKYLLKIILKGWFYMDYNEIKKVIKDMEECSLEELDIEFTDGTKIKMKNLDKRYAFYIF